jgi:hypothetical protein
LPAAWLLVSTLPREARSRLLSWLAARRWRWLAGLRPGGGGEHSRLRFFDYHHPIGAIGTFANRNHFADLMAMLVPLALAFAFAAQAHAACRRRSPGMASDRAVPRGGVEFLRARRSCSAASSPR